MQRAHCDSNMEDSALRDPDSLLWTQKHQETRGKVAPLWSVGILPKRICGAGWWTPVNSRHRNVFSGKSDRAEAYSYPHGTCKPNVSIPGLEKSWKLKISITGIVNIDSHL